MAENVSIHSLMQVVCVTHLLVEKGLITKDEAKQVLKTCDFTGFLIEKGLLEEGDMERVGSYYDQLVNQLRQYYSSGTLADRLSVMNNIKKLLDGESDDKQRQEN